MPVPQPLYVLAADHRWQLEEWCDAHGADRGRIPELKAIVVEGFRLARERSPAAWRHGALLLDEQYSSSLIAAARRDGILVATPVEKAGVFPLEWTSEPFDAALTGDLVKVIVRHRPEFGAERVAAERRKLRTLGDWCRVNTRPFLLEVVVMREHEDEATFETAGRPAILADYIRTSYDAGIVPDFWKMEGTTDAAAAAVVDEAVAEREGPKFLVLGKGAGFGLVEQWFAAARRMRTAGGFAIGRTVYWEPCVMWMDGRLDREGAVAQVAGNYERLIAAWEALADIRAS
jgi:5-dehydro-2-deoxygluconokinase